MFKRSILSALFLLSSFSVAQTTIAKYGGEFLAIGVGGRASGMGGAQVAVAGDITAAYWNPAGLARLDYPQISLMHEEHFGNLVNYNYAAVAFPLQKDMTVAVTLIRLGIDGIPDTRNAQVDENGASINNLLYPNWRLDYSKITEFSNVDYALYATFAKRESKEFYWGANVKLIKRNLAEYSALGIGFDVGAWYNPIKHLMLGANIMDVTTTLVAWSTGKKDLISPTVKLGVGYEFLFSDFHILPTYDMDVRFENRRFASAVNVGPVSVDPRFGIEFGYKKLFAFRAGYNDVGQFTIGAGVKLPKLNIDYSFARFNRSSYDRLGDSHRISLILTLEEDRFAR